MDSLYARYSSALLSLARDENKVKEYKAAIKSLADIFASSEKVSTFLKSYFIKDEDKYLIIDELCKPYQLKSLASFLKVLVKHHRFDQFKYIAHEFVRDCNEEIGISEGTIYSTLPLSKEQIKKIEEAIGDRLKQKVELNNKIDSNLIGGVKVVVHDHVFDGSLKNKLETMKTKLNERRDEQ